jgi:hypothetical protein
VKEQQCIRATVTKQFLIFLRAHLSAPLLLGLVGLALFWFLAHLDGIQTARLAELDHQQAAVVEQGLAVAKARRFVQGQSMAVDRENARLRAAVAQREANLQRLAHRADSLGAAVQPVLAALPDSVSRPVLQLLALKDSTIADLTAANLTLRELSDSLQADRDRWRVQDGRDAALAQMWEGQATRWRGQARKGCLPLIGCVSRSVTFLVGAGLGGAAVVALRP